jgi:hypothetical protein
MNLIVPGSWMQKSFLKNDVVAPNQRQTLNPPLFEIKD